MDTSPAAPQLPAIPAAPGRADLAHAAPAAPLYRALLSGKAAATVRSYAADYRDFAAFLRAGSYAAVPDPAAALEALLSFSGEAAIYCVLAYRESLAARGLSAATIARRIAAIKAAVRLGRAVGRIAWNLDAVEPPRVSPYRDTRGPDDASWRRLVAHAIGEASGLAGRRNLAIVRLLHDCALRRNEVAGLDREHFDGRRVAILGKGRSARELVTVPAPAAAALESWIADRGEAPGPLFSGLAGRGAGVGRITGEGIRLILRALAKRAGVKVPVRPHGLRHRAITVALDKTGGNVRAVMRFSRHARPETLMRYDDNRTDQAGEVAGLVASE